MDFCVRRGGSGIIPRFVVLVLVFFLSCFSQASANLPTALVLHGPALQLRLQSIWEKSAELPHFDSGPAKAPVRLIVFFDPNCPYCAILWKRLQPWMQRLPVRWVPIAFLKPSSLAIAATILRSPNPVKALAFNEGKYVFAAHAGGLLPMFQVPATLAKALSQSTLLWNQNFDISPTLLYHGAKKYHDVLGLPNDSQLRSWLGPPT